MPLCDFLSIVVVVGTSLGAKRKIENEMKSNGKFARDGFSKYKDLHDEVRVR